MDRTLVMSIKPQFAEAIFGGKKTVELRRVRPRVEAGDLVVVYASAPTMALVGAFIIDSLVSFGVSEMWRRYNGELGISAAEFENYFEGTDVAHGLVVGRRVRFPSIPLEELRRKGFRPPQSYMFWRRPLGELAPVRAHAVIEDIVGNVAAAE